MTTTNASDASKVEQYARALLEASRSEGRGNLDVQQMRHALKFTPEVLAILSEMQNSSEARLIQKVYEYLKDLTDGDETVVVDVTTAVPLDDELRGMVLAKCMTELKMPVYLVEHVEPSILGGIILEAQGQRRDASVKNQLVNIRKRLSATFMGIDTV